METSQASWDNGDWLAAWDGDRCVGHVGAFRFDTTVPGGARSATAGLHPGRGPADAHPTWVAHPDDATQPARVARPRPGAGQPAGQRGADLRPVRLRAGRRLRVGAHHQREDPPAARHARDGIDATAATRRGARRRAAAVRPCRPPLGRHHRPAAVDVEALPEGARRSRRRPRSARASSSPCTADPAGVDDGYVHYETDSADGFAAPFTGGRHDPRPVGSVRRRGRTRALAVPVRHRPDHHVARPTSVPSTTRSGDRSIDVRAYETRRHRRRAVGPPPRRRRRAHRSHLRSVRRRRSRSPSPIRCSRRTTIDGTISANGAQRTTDPADVIVDIATLSTAYMGGVAWRDLAASSAAADRGRRGRARHARRPLRHPPDRLLRLVLLSRTRER